MSLIWKILLVLILLIIAIWAYFYLGTGTITPNVKYGVTWSDSYAYSLGLDPAKGFDAMLSDLNVKYVRLPAYWNFIEPKQDEYDFSRLKQQLDEIAAHSGHALVIVGYKQPRWPECWMPDWAKALPKDQRDRAQLNYVERTVRTFMNHPAVEAWQVENEPSFIFKFGVCDPPLDQNIVAKEMALVKDIEKTNQHPHPIYTTASGEWSLWLPFSDLTDGVGISVYRVITNPWIGIYRYHLKPWSYMRKANLVSWLAGRIFVSEFQMEPWSDTALQDTPVADQLKTFDTNQMDDNFLFAQQMGFDQVYFWGAEWWYWMKEKQNNPAFWDKAKAFFQPQS